MNQTIVITPKVLNALRGLPTAERQTVAIALAESLLLDGKESVACTLKPVEEMIFNILHFYVQQASRRYSKSAPLPA